MNANTAAALRADFAADRARRGPDPREEQLYNRIVAAVIAKQLRPGERLNENRLARAHALSRTRVRRVLERLEREHIIRFELNRGAFVSRPSVKEARDTYEARTFVEEGIVRVACRRARPAGLPASFGVYLEREAQAYQRHELGVNRLSGDFHILLADFAGNTELHSILTSLVHRCCVIQSLYEWPQQDLCLNYEHREIADAIGLGDEDRAVAAMHAHLRHIIASLNLEERISAGLDIYCSPSSL